jgi:site-specific recombinase XerD
MARNEQLLAQMSVDMQLRGMSQETQVVYIRYARFFLEWRDKEGGELDERTAQAYLIHLVREGRISTSTVNVCNAAIRFLYAVTLNRTMNYLQLPRFKKCKTLPEILTRGEIQRLIYECSNVKHKAFFLLAYGGGLRTGEIAALRVRDIDSQSMRVFVHAGKGSKDRYTLLSNECLRTLRDYWLVYRPRHPDGWLFLGPRQHTHITRNAVTTAFSTWVKRLGITKDVSIHSLRHAFATHLLEDGATLFQIKELLGHACLNSTAVYIHLANTTAGIVSPADRFISHA